MWVRFAAGDDLIAKIAKIAKILKTKAHQVLGRNRFDQMFLGSLTAKNIFSFNPH
jgi:hypothetical protein